MKNIWRNMIRFNFHNHPTIEYSGDKPITVNFLNENMESVYSTQLTQNTWAQANPTHFIKWTLQAEQDNNIIFSHTLNLNNKRVIIENPYKTLGDFLLWVPVYDLFQRIHNCHLIVLIHRKEFAEIVSNSYPNILFVTDLNSIPMEIIYATYHPSLQITDTLYNGTYPKTQTVQQAFSTFFNVPYIPTVPLIDSTEVRLIDEKYICLTEFGSSNPWKCWITKEYGWHKISEYFNTIGYKVVPISNETTNLHGPHVINKSCCSLKEMIQYIKYADLTIGASTGPLVVSLALNKPTINICTATYPNFDLPYINVYNHTPNTCHSCHSWEPEKKPPINICPNRNPFPECSENITPEMVINKIKKLLGE